MKLATLKNIVFKTYDRDSKNPNATDREPRSRSPHHLCHFWKNLGRRGCAGGRWFVTQSIFEKIWRGCFATLSLNPFFEKKKIWRECFEEGSRPCDSINFWKRLRSGPQPQSKNREKIFDETKRSSVLLLHNLDLFASGACGRRQPASLRFLLRSVFWPQFGVR